jgi:hypothetical protein
MGTNFLHGGCPPPRPYPYDASGAVLMRQRQEGIHMTADEKPITHVTFLVSFFDDLRRRVPVSK